MNKALDSDNGGDQAKEVHSLGKTPYTVYNSLASANSLFNNYSLALQYSC